MENYIKIELPLTPEKQEIALALLAEMGFEAFEEKPRTLEAYILEPLWDEEQWASTLQIVGGGEAISFTKTIVPPKNWNAEWEKNFQTMEVDDFCEVRAPFKEPAPGFTHHLIIQPKMSFGTGHHATTRMMIRQCKKLDFEGKSVLDMGCGTGILGILASKLGANKILGVDIDQWSYDNAMENIALNNIDNMTVQQGDASSLPDECYAIILANINRNVLLADVNAYRSHLDEGGIIVLSGFMHADESLVNDHYQAAGFHPLHRFEEGEWLSQSFILRKP